MATNKELKKALLEKLGITPQALSQRIQRMRDKSPMSTEEGTYLIAHMQGIRIDKYLDEGQVKAIRELDRNFNTQVAPPSRLKKNTSKKDSTRIIKFPEKFNTSDPLLDNTKLKEATEMAAIYPILYVLENSIRELIKRVMEANYGEHWWHEKTKTGRSKSIGEKVKQRMANEQKNKWHQRRGAHPIYYTNLTDLKTLLSSNGSKFFPHILSKKEWFLNLMDELEPSRNVLCHMNPLEPNNINDIKVKFERWQRLLKENMSNIPD